VDQSWFDAVPLIAFTATKEMNYALNGRVVRSMTMRILMSLEDVASI
jgi:hypothetical protein